jgi:hypothetical protein
MSQDKLPLSDAAQELAAGYVLGDLDPDELAQFKALLHENSALQAEVGALQTSLRILPQGLEPATLPPQLGDRILSAYAASSRAVPSRRLSGLGLLAGLSLLAALFLGFDNLRLRRTLSLAQQSPPPTVATLLQRPNSRLVALRSQTPAQPAGTLLFTPGKWQKVVVSLNNLPPLPPDQVYRLWLTLNQGDILSCGEFKPDTAGRVFVTLAPEIALPKNAKATGVFVTQDLISAPMQPSSDRILSGEI